MYSPGGVGTAQEVHAAFICSSEVVLVLEPEGEVQRRVTNVLYFFI